MIWLLSLALAADPPACESVQLPEVESSISVAWVSKVGKTVGRNGEITVVPTAELRTWVAAESRGSVGRMLQRLGLRGRPSDPKSLWKVVVFDALPSDLCRPVAGHEDPVAIGGLVSCKAGKSKPSAGQTGCGRTVDRATGQPGPVQFRGSWADVARNGFCVLPAERFVSEGR